jgi:hypothetical protein
MSTPHPNVPADWADDPYWRAAVCLLHPYGNRAFQHATGNGIDFTGLLEDGWSSGELRIIQAAASLWDGSVAVSLLELVAGLDEPNWRRLLSALTIMREGLA